MTFDRRNKDKPPRPGMIWSEKHLLWMDPDDRSPERKAKDEAIAAEHCRKRGCRHPGAEKGTP